MAIYNLNDISNYWNQIHNTYQGNTNILTKGNSTNNITSTSNWANDVISNTLSILNNNSDYFQNLDQYNSIGQSYVNGWENAGGFQFRDTDDKNYIYKSQNVLNWQKQFENSYIGKQINNLIFNNRSSNNPNFNYPVEGMSGDARINGNVGYDDIMGYQTYLRTFGAPVGADEKYFKQWADWGKQRGATGAYIDKDFFYFTTEDPSKWDTTNKTYINFNDPLNLTLNTKADTPDPNKAKGFEINNPNSQFIGEIPTNIKEVEPLKQNKLLNFLPDALASSRLWLTLRNNRKVRDIYNQSIRPVLKDTYERYSPVTGDFGMLSLKNRQAADTLFRANQPYTSDASLNVARSLEAQRQANQLQTEGYLADNQRIRETQREALLRQEDNMARRSEVANFNRAQLQDVRERRAENDALTQKANWQSWDQYLQGFEKRFRADALKRENDINEWNDLIIQQNAQRKHEIGYRNIQNKIKALEAQYGYNIPEYKQLEIQQDLARLEAGINDYRYQQKAKLENIPYTGTYTRDQLNSIIFKRFKSGGKFVPKFQRGSSIGNALAIYQDNSGPYYDTITQYELQRRYGGSNSGSSKSSSKKSGDSDSEKGAFTRKDFINSIKDANLLPNDINALYSTVTGLFNRIKMMGSDVSDISQLYLQIMPMLNNAKMNRKRYDEIETKLRNEGKLYELAYYQGGVYATDSQTRKIVHITKDQLNENKQRYSPITYGQLLWCTQNMPEQAYNHSWLEAASSAISLKDVMDLLKNNFYKLGTDTTKVDYFGTNQQYAQTFKELQHLLAAPEGYYKLTQLLKNPTQQGGGIAGLFNAAITMLPEAARGRLMFATQNGTGEELYGLVAQMIAGQQDYTNELNLSPVTTVDENGRIGTKSKSSSKAEDPIEGFWRSIQAQRGDNYQISIIKDKGRLSATGNIYTSVPNIDKNMSLSDFLYKSGGMNLVQDKSAISFGDIKLDQKSLSDVMVDSSSNFVTVMLPKNPDGSVDFGVLDEYLEIKDSNPNNYLQQMQNAGLGYLYNSDGTPNQNQFGLFLVVEGLASDKTQGINKEGKPASLKDVESNYTIKYKNDREMQDKLIQGLSSKENGEYELDDVNNGWWNPGDSLFGSDSIYKGNIYIPISKSPIKASWADETKIKTSVAKDYDLMQQTKEKESIMNNDTELD